MKSFVVRLEKQRSDEVFSCLQKTGIDDSNDMYNNNNNNGPSGGGQ